MLLDNLLLILRVLLFSIMISIIVAVSKNGVIGKKGQLPWYLPADLKRFKKLTMGHPIIMGRKTYESIGRTLPGRTNIVVTRNKNLWNLGGSTKGCEIQEEGSGSCVVVESLDEAIRVGKNSPGGAEVFVIGGSEIFNQAMPIADKIYMTTIDEIIDGDILMPKIDMSMWQETHREKFSADEKNIYNYEFINYERK